MFGINACDVDAIAVMSDAVDDCICQRHCLGSDPVSQKECCKDIRNPREGKTVYIGSSWKDVAYTDSEGKSKTITMRIVYEVIERTTDKNGQFLLVPDIECNTIWTNLGWSDDDIINGYHAHGECEQFHSEIKTDMDVERLPSGKLMVTI